MHSQISPYKACTYKASTLTLYSQKLICVRINVLIYFSQYHSVYSTHQAYTHNMEPQLYPQGVYPKYVGLHPRSYYPQTCAPCAYGAIQYRDRQCMDSEDQCLLNGDLTMVKRYPIILADVFWLLKPEIKRCWLDADLMLNSVCDAFPALDQHQAKVSCFLVLHPAVTSMSVAPRFLAPNLPLCRQIAVAELISQGGR